MFHLYSCCILSILLYDCDTWSLTSDEWSEFKTFRTWCQCCILVTRSDFIRNTAVQKASAKPANNYHGIRHGIPPAHYWERSQHQTLTTCLISTQIFLLPSNHPCSICRLRLSGQQCCVRSLTMWRGCDIGTTRGMSWILTIHLMWEIVSCNHIKEWTKCSMNIGGTWLLYCFCTVLKLYTVAADANDGCAVVHCCIQRIGHRWNFLGSINADSNDNLQSIVSSDIDTVTL